jgi:hypothetical protein
VEWLRLLPFCVQGSGEAAVVGCIALRAPPPQSWRQCCAWENEQHPPTRLRTLEAVQSSKRCLALLTEPLFSNVVPARPRQCFSSAHRAVCAAAAAAAAAQARHHRQRPPMHSPPAARATHAAPARRRSSPQAPPQTVQMASSRPRKRHIGGAIAFCLTRKRWRGANPTPTPTSTPAPATVLARRPRL